MIPTYGTWTGAMLLDEREKIRGEPEGSAGSWRASMVMCTCDLILGPGAESPSFLKLGPSAHVAGPLPMSPQTACRCAYISCAHVTLQRSSIDFEIPWIPYLPSFLIQDLKIELCRNPFRLGHPRFRTGRERNERVNVLTRWALLGSAWLVTWSCFRVSPTFHVPGQPEPIRGCTGHKFEARKTIMAGK